jgi:hydroxymethylpyrimidine pyrophosphatase-like HAD family hydrolase
MEKTKIRTYMEDRCDCIICDLDGTLAINQNRGWFEYAKVIDDPVDPRLLRIIKNYLKQKVRVFFVTGREDIGVCREMTRTWLEKHLPEFEYVFDYNLIMREKGDRRGDQITKKELYERYIKDYYNVLCVFDDRQKVVDMWREQGLLCCQVAKGDY